MSSIKYRPRSEQVFFPEDDRDSWEPTLMELAGLNMPAKSLADHFGCSYQTLVNNEHAMYVVRVAWADYRRRVEAELYLMAMEQPDPNSEDPKVYQAKMQAKTKALQMLHKVLHTDIFVPPAEAERIRRLSDEELQKELEKHLKFSTNRNNG